MNARTGILVIALEVVSLALAPTLIINQSADAQSLSSKGWCESQGKSINWVNGCKNGWYDHDHCWSYDPDGESNAFYNGYKIGWKKGHCK
jgi:hypothetical protein